MTRRVSFGWICQRTWERKRDRWIPKKEEGGGGKGGGGKEEAVNSIFSVYRLTLKIMALKFSFPIHSSLSPLL